VKYNTAWFPSKESCKIAAWKNQLVLLVSNETKHNQIETKFNFAVIIRLFTQKMSMKKDETHTTVIRPEWNIA
jgi:hypothetical protein